MIAQASDKRLLQTVSWLRALRYFLLGAMVGAIIRLTAIRSLEIANREAGYPESPLHFGDMMNLPTGVIFFGSLILLVSSILIMVIRMEFTTLYMPRKTPYKYTWLEVRIRRWLSEE